MDAQFTILSWAYWQADSLNSQPALPEVPAMQRRRFSRLSKMALRAGLDLAFPIAALPSVFASRHGELHRTAELLLLLEEREALSPAKFSQSVYNTASGLFGINQGNTCSSTVVTCGANTLAMAFVEAYAQSVVSNGPVLLIYADEPLPELYAAYADEQQNAVAFACVLSAQASQWSSLLTPQTQTVHQAEDLASQLLKGLQSQQAQFTCSTADFCWAWSLS